MSATSPPTQTVASARSAGVANAAAAPLPQSWAVVGGGMLGLTLALRLAEQGHRVTVYEGAAEVGGLAAAWQLGNVVWDRHYHVTLLSDQHLRGLLAELGLDAQVRWVETRTGFFTDNRWYSLSNSWEFLRFPPLRLVDKLRLGATLAYAARVKNWRRLEELPVADWLARLSGRRTTEKIWLPLLRAKLGENYRRTSAAFIWSTINRLYAARRTGLKKELFGYVPGGYARVLARLHEHLTERGVEVLTESRVDDVRAAEAGNVIVRRGTVERQFDRVVLTTPASVAARLCPQFSADERARLTGIEYQGILCASVLTERPWQGFYVTNITEPDVPFTAIIEMTTLVDPRELGGQTLVYLPKYLAADDPLWSASDAEIEDRFLAAAERMVPGFRRADVRAFRVSRVKEVLALSTLGYSRRLPPRVTSVPGVFLAGSYHIVNGTLNVNETVKLAAEAARELGASAMVGSAAREGARS